MSTGAARRGVRVTIDPELGRITRIRPPRKDQIALTFDDGPHPVQTPIVLDILSQYGVRANFFLIGTEAKKYPDLVTEICQRGHVVGSHSWGHSDLTTLDSTEAQSNIIAGHDTVKALSATATPFFRFPYLKYNAELESIIWNQGLVHLLADIDPQDWCASSSDAIVNAACEQFETLRNGIVLLHDPLEVTARALPLLLDRLTPIADFIYFDWVGQHAFQEDSTRSTEPSTTGKAN